jgi:hypothetical protein
MLLVHLEQIQGLNPIQRLDDLESRAFQEGAKQIPHCRLVVRHQRQAAKSNRFCRGLGGKRRQGPLHGREEHSEKGALPSLALQAHPALMSAHNALHRRQPQSSTCELSSEKGIEDAVLSVLIHALPIVFHLQREEGAGAHGLGGPQAADGFLGDLAEPCADLDASHALLQRFGRVGHEVQHHLLNLAGVPLHRGKILWKIEL